MEENLSAVNRNRLSQAANEAARAGTNPELPPGENGARFEEKVPSAEPSVSTDEAALAHSLGLDGDLPSASDSPREVVSELPAALHASTPGSEALPGVRRRYDQPELRVVVFQMAGHEYAVNVAQVQEVIRPTNLISIDGVPDYVEGLVERRGRIVPIVDLRKRLGLTVSPPTVESCVIVVKLSIGLVGFLADSASELIWVKTRDFEIPSRVIAGIEQVYLQGVAHLGDRLLVMLDLQRLLTQNEQASLSEHI